MHRKAAMMSAGLMLCAAFGATAQPRLVTIPAPTPTTPQPSSTSPPLQLPTPSPTAQPLPAPRPGNPVLLSSQDMRARMRAYLATRGSQLLPRAVLTQAGLSAENDAVEQGVRIGGVWMAPLHVGLAGTVTPPPLNVDPAALEGARVTARRRVGREPTEAEIAQELAAFDQSITRINQSLAQRQSEIASAYKQSGRFPREIEAPLLGVPSSTSLTGADRTALQRLLTMLFNAPTPTHQ